jgi:hypothetical protein
MILTFSRDKKILRTNSDFANAVPEFAEVLNDAELGIDLLAYVAYCTDVAEDNIWTSYPADIRKKEVAESLGIESAKLKNPKVIAALKRYKSFVDQNAGYRFKSAYDDGMRKISDYVTSKGKLQDEDAKEFSAVMKEMPIILKGKSEIEKVGVKEASKTTVRGQKQLTLNERG